MIAVKEAVQAEQIVPLKGRVLVRRAKKAEKTSGGIILPEETQELSQLGEVINVGAGVTEVKKGDVVVFSIYASLPIIAVTGEEQELLMIREADIVATVVEDLLEKYDQRVVQ